jgi:hypothetical protein
MHADMDTSTPHTSRHLSLPPKNAPRTSRAPAPPRTYAQAVPRHSIPVTYHANYGLFSNACRAPVDDILHFPRHPATPPLTFGHCDQKTPRHRLSHLITSGRPCPFSVSAPGAPCTTWPSLSAHATSNAPLLSQTCTPLHQPLPSPK